MSHLKVAVFARNNNFLSPILFELGRRKIIYRGWITSDDSTFGLLQGHELMEWCDVAFFDFCQDPLPRLSRLTIEKPIVARLHGLEVYSPEARVIDWKRIHLICSAPEFERYKIEGLHPPADVTILPIGVGLEPTCTPKTLFGHNIGLIAYTPLPRKRIYTTIESFWDLCEQSKSQWILHIRGARTTGYRDGEAREYLKFINELRASAVAAINERIIFHDFLPNAQYAQFLKNLDIIISNSMQEGYHKAVFEAMSYGTYPLVHEWMGAKSLYEGYTFISQRQLVDKIIAWDELSNKSKEKCSLHVQKLVRLNHDEEAVARTIVDILFKEGKI